MNLSWWSPAESLRSDQSASGSQTRCDGAGGQCGRLLEHMTPCLWSRATGTWRMKSSYWLRMGVDRAAPACFLVSMVLLALRGTISDLFSVVVGNLLLLVGCLLLLLGAQRFFGVAAKRPLWNWPVFFALATSALIWTTLIEPDYGLRLRAMTLLLFSIIFSLALLVRQKTGSTFAGRFCTLVLLLQSAVIFLRFVATFLWPSGTGLFEPFVYQTMYIASFAFTMLLFTVGTVLLLNERLRVEFQTIINAAKQSESNALATKNRLQATLDAIPDLLFELGLDGKYHDYHSPHTDLIAAAPGVPLRNTVHQVLAPDAAHACMTAVQEAHQNGQSRGQQFQLQLPQGVRWFELSVARMNVERGQEPRCIVLSRDITERKLSEVALQQSLRDKDALLKEVHHRVTRPGFIRARCGSSARLMARIMSSATGDL
jgi:PAS domain-containing protein